MSQEATSAEDTQQVTEQEAETQEEAPQTLTLRKDQLYRELSRIDSEDPELRQVLRSWAGNTAKRQYLPELRQRDQEIAQLKADKFQASLSNLTEAEIQQKLIGDSSFREQLNDYLSRQDGTKSAQQAQDDPAEVEAAVNDLAWWAHGRGLPEEAWQRLASKAATGAYKPPVEPAKGALSKAGPDVTRGTASSAPAGTFPRTAQDFNKLPQAEQLRWIASDRARVQALSQK